MKVAFHNPNVSIRGAFAAMVDYAEFNQSLLGNVSTLFIRRSRAAPYLGQLAALTRGLPVVMYETLEELGQEVREFGADFFYEICPGSPHRLPRLPCPIGVHAIFPHTEFFGDRYRYVSPWLARVMTGRSDLFVPHLVRRYESRENLRPQLGIPPGVRVFGRHGGADTFNIPFVHEVVAKHARKNPGDHFVFLNTQKIAGTESLRNVHYLPATLDPGAKARFLATCDAMLHARWHGETFGLAVGEFAVLGKPVITYADCRERAHLDLLGGGAISYRGADDLAKILRAFAAVHSPETAYEAFADPRLIVEYFQKFILCGEGT
ncbi:MAG: hypothetical protein EBZ78_03020 [Verrucomicrobia bacterium]|nr:hypothetical protein [Verrucomicrobiota bacterium]